MRSCSSSRDRWSMQPLNHWSLSKTMELSHCFTHAWDDQLLEGNLIRAWPDSQRHCCHLHMLVSSREVWLGEGVTRYWCVEHDGETHPWIVYLSFEVQHADNNWQAIGLGQVTWGRWQSMNDWCQYNTAIRCYISMQSDAIDNRSNTRYKINSKVCVGMGQTKR